MRYLFSLLFLVSLSFPAVDSPIKKLTYSLWPEYDHEGVLVIYTGTIDSSKLPFRIRLVLEKGAHKAIIKGALPSDSVRSANVVMDGELPVLEDIIIQPDFIIEYYFNPFPDKSTDRNFSLDFRFPYYLDSLQVIIQQPVFAKDFKSSLSALSDFRIIEDMHRMKYHKTVFRNVQENKPVPLQFSYTNPDNDLSLLFFQRMMQMSQGNQQPPPNQQPPSAFPAERWFFWALIFIGLLTATYYFYTKKSSEKEK